MTLQIANFTFGTNPLTVVGTWAEPYFYADEVATMLGIKDHHKMYKRLREGYKTLLRYTTPNRGSVEPDLVLRDKYRPNTVMLTEAGLYYVICTTHSDKATQFQDWVFQCILPTIRMHGKYSVNNLKTIRDEVDDLNSKRIDLQTFCEKGETTDDFITVGKVCDELYPKQYRRSFKQVAGRAVSKAIRPVRTDVIDSFQSGHKKMIMTANVYRTDNRAEMEVIIRKLMEDNKHRFLLINPK